MSVEVRTDWKNLRLAATRIAAVIACVAFGLAIGTQYGTEERREHIARMNELDARVDNLEVDTFGDTFGWTTSNEPTSADDLTGRLEVIEKVRKDKLENLGYVFDAIGDDIIRVHRETGEVFRQTKSGEWVLDGVAKRPEQAPPQPPSDGFTGGLEYVDEKDFKEGQEFGRNMPRIIVDGRKLEFNRHAEGYIDVEYGVPVGWADFGGDYQLADVIDIRADDASTDIKANDILFRPKKGELSLATVDPRVSRPIKPGDPIHANAAKWLFSQEWISPDRSCGIARIGNTNLWAKFEGKGDWVIADPATFPELLAKAREADVETRLRNGERVTHDDGSVEEIVPFASINGRTGEVRYVAPASP